MKKVLFISLIFFLLTGLQTSAQRSGSAEKFGSTLNLGLGIGGYAGYYGYIGETLPVFHLNFEFDVARNFTLAPFITFYTYRSDHYRETVIPMGVKGSYYFDQLLKANPRWDFYLAGSLGFAVVNSRWDNNYDGDRKYYHSGSPLFLDIHAGTEYHFNNHIGMFLDLSTGVSTIGLAFH
ncbi:MAG: hypothetical protein FD166_3507 [Bacteroidetes bacterium]|nr:MAG: hypothetical protein FD166_3507 [Bacteroidota bacterium]